jgi:hypothetical protein
MKFIGTFLLTLFAAGCSGASKGTMLDLSTLRVESGRIDAGPGHSLAIRSAGVRAVAQKGSGSAVEMSFVYRGPSGGVEPLASGELRRQIGLKLRALDTCNVVYVMWHIEPTRGIHVSVKANPDAHDHASCGDRGYTFVEPARSSVVPAITAGERHTLAARLDVAARSLRVDADGAAAWEGPLPAAAFGFDGPVGLRSDNGDFDVELRALH